MHVLVTGATGYIGKHVLARLLESGHRVTVLVRPQGGRLHARMVDALRPLQPHARPLHELPRITVLAGDITLADCGLTAGDLGVLADAPPEACIHCAGLTRFDAHLAAAIHRHNLDGTRHAHALAKHLGIARFHHLSTAFVAGDTPACFGPGDRDRGQSFHNPYEASKHAAEVYLAAAAQAGDPAISVYRPSIVVGGCASGDTHAVSTVYTFIKALHFLRTCSQRDALRDATRPRSQDPVSGARRCHVPLDIAADPNVALDLVDIDDVVDGIMRGLAATARHTVHHLTGRPITLAHLRDGICEALAVDGPRLVGTVTRKPRSRLARQFERLTQVYRPYLRHTARFTPPSDYQPRAVDPYAFTQRFLRELDDAGARTTPRGIGALSLAIAGIHQPEDYFHALAEGRVGRLFLARHDFVDLRVAFRIRGGRPCHAMLHIRNGRAHLLTEPVTAASDCVYALDDRLFMRVVSGQTDLRTAFFAGKVHIDGDKERALKFGALLGMYFRDIDDHVLEELAG